MRVAQRTLGSAGQNAQVISVVELYPACAGISPGKRSLQTCEVSLPRVRGDQPRAPGGTLIPRTSAPRMRGSAHHADHVSATWACCPVYAGIDLRMFSVGQAHRALPRERGDRPIFFSRPTSFCAVAPRMRGPLLSSPHPGPKIPTQAPRSCLGRTTIRAEKGRLVGHRWGVGVRHREVQHSCG